MPTTETMYGDELRELEILHAEYKEANERPYGVAASIKNSVRVTPLVPKSEKGRDPKLAVDAVNIQRLYMGSKGGPSPGDDILRAQTSVVSHREVKKRSRGDPVIIER
jgi:hypothetical protein